MIIKHSRGQETFDLMVDYDELIGDWRIPLNSYLDSNSHSNLMFNIHHKYGNLNLNPLPITKQELFKPYKLTQYKDVRVVIVDMKFTMKKNNNGLAFGNKYSTDINDYDEDLVELFKEIEDKEHDGCNIDEDYTLEKWAKQGVLLLNYGLHVDNTQRYIAYDLMKETLKALNTNKTGIIFCFINNVEKFFISNINTYSNILISNNENTLTYDVLKEINDHIEKSNGRDFRIKW